MSTQQETYTKIKSNKTLSTTKSKRTFLTQINSLLIDIKTFFIWLINKINNVLSKCSMITHFVIILVPISILFIFLIFFIHLNFYDKLFRFNYYKGVKEEFLDLYITEIDDMHSEIETFLIKENYLDIENILFFDIYFRELASIGLLDNPEESIFPDIHYESEKMYKEIDDFYVILNMNCMYSIPSEIANDKIDKRRDTLKELAKIYYYNLPILNYAIYYTGIDIEHSYLIAYEFDKETKNVNGEELFFSFPTTKGNFNEDLNFVPNNEYLNPLINREKPDIQKLINNSYYNENYFTKQDWDFRNYSILDREAFSIVSLSHLNKENNGNITKSLIISLQLNLNRNDKHFVVNIIFYLSQRNLVDDAIEYNAFIIRNNTETHYDINEKYSDNETFVISKQEFTEYSLSVLNEKYFHYGLLDKNNNFLKNGVSFDSFNLNILFDPFKYYLSVEGYNMDLRYLQIYYLYFKMFQNIKNSHYKKEGEEISLNIFEDQNKVKDICNDIDLERYIGIIKDEEEIDCWDSQNLLYYGEDYKDATLFDSYTSIPFCACLPLYCLNNYKSLKENDYKFSQNNIVSKINLPDRCQNKFSYYYNENEPKFVDSYIASMSSFVFYLFNNDAKIPEKIYNKIEKENLNQLPGYYLIVFSEIESNTNSIFYLFYNTVSKIEIIVILIITLLFTFIITIVILHKNLKKISLIIDEFTQKYEQFVYHSKCNDVMMNQDSEKNINHQFNNNNIEKKMKEHNINSENIPFLQNENTSINDLYDNENFLIEDLFSIYCKYYNVSRKELEKYYSKKTHETKYQMKLKIMTEKNELFKLLCMFSIYAPFFRLNLSLDYKMYKYSKIIKKYDQYVEQVASFDKEQAKLTKNILYELLSTENISDYGLVTNLNFKYISNINAENKENSIQNALFKNVINQIKGKNEDQDDDMNINDIFSVIKDTDEKQNIKLILKKKNELMELFKNKFESDDYLNFNKIESSFNFFLINSYYKYLKQISLEKNNTK